jgi:uncharacterized membrane protein YeaQ/YmgE (transglycosylase-associated protein family)
VDFGSIVAALALGLVCGIIARVLVPGDIWRHVSGPKSWLISIGLGLLGALVGYWIFTGLFGIGDDDIFDWGGIIGAVIGTIIVVIVGTVIIRMVNRRKDETPAVTASSTSTTPPQSLPAADQAPTAPPPPASPQPPAPPSV